MGIPTQQLRFTRSSVTCRRFNILQSLAPVSWSPQRDLSKTVENGANRAHGSWGDSQNLLGSDHQYPEILNQCFRCRFPLFFSINSLYTSTCTPCAFSSSSFHSTPPTPQKSRSKASISFGIFRVVLNFGCFGGPSGGNKRRQLFSFLF